MTHSLRLNLRYLFIATLIAFIGVSTVFGQGRGRGKGGNGNDGGRGQGKQYDRGDKKVRDYVPGERGQIRQRQRVGVGQFESPIWRQRDNDRRNVDRGNSKRGRGNKKLDQPIYVPRRYDDGGYYRRRNEDRRRDRARNSNDRIIVSPYRNGYDYIRRSRNYGPFKNYGQYRSNQVHIRNERRKALRNNRYWDDYYYDDRRYRRPDRRRVVLGNILGNVWGNRYDNYRPVYRSRAYEPVYYSSPPSYVERRYYDESYGYTSYYENDTYNDQLASPLFGDSSVGQFVSRLLGGLLASGYDQGFAAGEYARTNGYADRSYYNPYDPYVYNNVSFDDVGYNPYSCFGERNLYLSEGYELGYQDAMRDQAQNASYYDRGNNDVASLLVGSFL